MRFDEIKYNCEVLSMQDLMLQMYYRELVKKKDDVIKAALMSAGFDPNDIKLLLDNFQLIRKENDKYEHLYFKYGTEEEKRIISIEIDPKIILPNPNDEVYKIEATYKYY